MKSVFFHIHVVGEQIFFSTFTRKQLMEKINNGDIPSDSNRIYCDNDWDIQDYREDLTEDCSGDMHFILEGVPMQVSNSNGIKSVRPVNHGWWEKEEDVSVSG